MRPVEDLTGQLIHRWRVLGPGVLPGEWICRCECDGRTERVLSRRSLLQGKPRSCGCLQAEAGRNARANFMDSPWTPERVEFLLANYQSFTRQKLAEQLGPPFTKNSVIAKLNRLGLSEPMPAPPVKKLALSNAKAGGCMWPQGDPREPDFTFCGAVPTVPGRSYCARHLAIAIDHPKKSAADGRDLG